MPQVTHRGQSFPNTGMGDMCGPTQDSTEQPLSNQFADSTLRASGPTGKGK